MTNIIIKKHNLEIINNTSDSLSSNLKKDFLSVINHLYEYSIFKNILDIVVTKCSVGQLKFKIQDAKFFDIDSGNCVTMVSNNGYTSTRQKKYLITIKKIASDVIMHEIAHMLEHELSVYVSLSSFASVLMREINAAPIYMKSVMQSLFLDALKGYPQSQHISELFARFFQFFAGANEVAYRSSLNARYKLNDVIALFPYTLELLDSSVGSSWNEIIDPRIAAESKKYLQCHNIKREQWADKRIKTTNIGDTTSSRWSVKSNKADPFK